MIHAHRTATTPRPSASHREVSAAGDLRPTLCQVIMATGSAGPPGGSAARSTCWAYLSHIRLLAFLATAVLHHRFSARCRRSASASCWLFCIRSGSSVGKMIRSYTSASRSVQCMDSRCGTRFESFHRNQFPLILFDAVVMVNQWLVLRHQQVTCRYGQPGAIAPKLFATVKGFSGG